MVPLEVTPKGGLRKIKNNTVTAQTEKATTPAHFQVRSTGNEVLLSMGIMEATVTARTVVLMVAALMVVTVSRHNDTSQLVGDIYTTDIAGNRFSPVILDLHD